MTRIDTNGKTDDRRTATRRGRRVSIPIWSRDAPVPLSVPTSGESGATPARVASHASPRGPLSLTYSCFPEFPVFLLGCFPDPCPPAFRPLASDL